MRSLLFHFPLFLSLAVAVGAFSAASAHAESLRCGQVLTRSTELHEDLVCPGFRGTALSLVGDNLTLIGNGHRIVAPMAGTALFVQGANSKVSGVVVRGSAGGLGILAYQTPELTLEGNDVSENGEGIAVYADASTVHGVRLLRNQAMNCGRFGIRISSHGAGSIENPKVEGNQLDGAGAYALYVLAGHFELGGDHGNSFARAANGIYVAGKSVSLHDFSLRSENIEKIGIFADSVESLLVDRIDVSSFRPVAPPFERVGLDIYRAGTFAITRVTGEGNDVAVKFETELGTESSGFVRDGLFEENSVSGILVVSYDATPYGVVRFAENCYAESEPARRVLIVPGTRVAFGSVLDDGLNYCSLPAHRLSYGAEQLASKPE